jgi:predicted nucleotide-binding protein
MAGLPVRSLPPTPPPEAALSMKQDDAEFAIILMTPDDLGHLRPELLPPGSAAPAATMRRRQNVIFEMGFFIGSSGSTAFAH